MEADKKWYVIHTYSGYENKVKENLLQRAQTYNMLENILRVEIPTQTVQVEKNGKKKEVEENPYWTTEHKENVKNGQEYFLNSFEHEAKSYLKNQNRLL